MEETVQLHLCLSKCLLDCVSIALALFILNAESLFVVGFVETMYTVSEGDGQVEVCVTLVSSEGDIGNESVIVDVINNKNPLSIPADAAAASELGCTCC